MEKMIQITAGRGPAECCWVVAQVLKQLLQEARAQGLTATLVDREAGVENGTLFSALVLIDGTQVDSFLKTWLGTIQWIGKSTFRKHHRRTNWFVGVSLVGTSKEFQLDESQIKYQAIRSGGPGGQHVNKVSTAIRATYKPTGISVLASDNRSQKQNKKMARARLLLAVQKEKLEHKTQQVKAAWQNHNELERGNPVRVFKGTDFKKRTVKDQKKSDRQAAKKKLRTKNYDAF